LQVPMAPAYLDENPENFTSYPYDDDGSGPCNLTVRGFNPLGLTITYMLVFVFSTVGNGVVVWVVCWIAKRRTSTDIYLTHLAAANLLFGLTLPFWAVDARSGWIFGTALCKLLSGLQEASEYGGVFLLACISVDRHLAIVKATRVKSSHGPVVKATCAAVWLVAAVLSIPTAVQRRHMGTEDPDRDICYEDVMDESSNRWYVLMHIARHVLGFFLPLAVMAVCYGSTLVTLYHTHNRQKQKAIRVIVAVVLAFIVCWLPYNVVLLIQLLIQSSLVEVESCGTRDRVWVALDVTKVLAFVHCAVNPVLYAFIGVKFRNQLLSVAHKWGLVGSRLVATYRGSSASSGGSARSRNT
uniref:C-X-C motif chemokine receptor 1 n=2 Tax=Tetraodon nigroviridis TaxID=99883 RepID=H3CU05_TETNG